MNEFKYKVTFLNEKIEKLNGLVTILYNRTTELDIDHFDKSELIILAEIRSLIDNLEFYIGSNPDIESFEISSFIESANHVYSEFASTIRDDDKNTSWLVSRYDQYNEISKSVVDLIKSTL